MAPVLFRIIWLRESKHTSLHDVHRDILHDSLDLALHEPRRHDMHTLDARRVLLRQGRRGRHGVAPMGGNDLLVRLEAAGQVSVLMLLEIASRSLVT